MKYNYSFGRNILSMFQLGSWLLLIIGVILLLSALGSSGETFIIAVVIIISSLSGILSCIIGGAIIHSAETNQEISETNKQILKQLGENQVNSSDLNSGPTSPSLSTSTNSPVVHEEYLGHNIFKDHGMYKVGAEEFMTLLAAKAHIEDIPTNANEKESSAGKVPYYLRGE